MSKLEVLYKTVKQNSYYNQLWIFRKILQKSDSQFNCPWKMSIAGGKRT